MTADAVVLRVGVLAVSGVVSTTALLGLSRRVAGHPRWTRHNFRGSAVTLAAGPAVVAGLLSGAAVIGAATYERAAAALAVTAVVAGLSGLYDDLFGDVATKGLRGHLRTLLGGRVTSGSAKLIAIAVAGLASAAVLDASPTVVLVEGALVAGTANLVNLFDLRPGRAAKVVLITALPVTAIGGPAGAVAVAAAGATFGALPWDLQERTMLGDAGANALGGGVGLAIAAGAPVEVSAVVLAVVVALTLASERISFTRVIDSLAPLRWVDALGRRR